MKVGIIGSGSVGQQLGLGFLKSGHEVKIGTRNPGKLSKWLEEANNDKASVGSFSDAATFGEMVVIATLWTGTENAIDSAGKDSFSGKVVIDVTNPLLFEREGEAPTFALAYPKSGGASIQLWLPKANVVKAFNIVTAHHMTNAKLQEGVPDMFIAGNNDDAKKTVTEIAEAWGWPVTDIGLISQSYLLEAMAMLWVRYGFINNHWTHAFKLLKK